MEKDKDFAFNIQKYYNMILNPSYQSNISVPTQHNIVISTTSPSY